MTKGWSKPSSSQSYPLFFIQSLRYAFRARRNALAVRSFTMTDSEPFKYFASCFFA